MEIYNINAYIMEKEFLIKDNRYNFDMCKKYDCNYVLIDKNYPIEFFL